MRARVLHRGFGGVDIGMENAGIEVVSAIEYDPEIAAVADKNFDCQTTIADINEYCPDKADIDILHCSPPCPKFSLANFNRGETEDDIMMARSICKFIINDNPKVFTLENVWGYIQSYSLILIWYTLLELGYGVNFWNLNAADYGVPQTRKRLILVAYRNGRIPTKPPQTHYKPNRVKKENGFVGSLFWKPWCGWYEAIEDLIPELPETSFANWQLERLPVDSFTFVSDSLNYNSRNPNRKIDEPIFTVTNYSSKHPAPNAFIVDQQKGAMGCKDNRGRGLGIREGGEPCFTIGASGHNQWLRSFIAVGGNSSSFSVRTEEEPARTVGDTGRVGNIPRAWLSSGRTVKMTPRCLARFQSFPDWYTLPQSTALACRGIGNAVPPLFYERIMKHILRELK